MYELLAPKQGRRVAAEELFALAEFYQKLCRARHIDVRGKHTGMARLPGCPEAADSLAVWLLYQDHAVHLLPPSVTAQRSDPLQRVESVRLTPDSRLALTDRGAVFAQQFLADLDFDRPAKVASIRRQLQMGRLVPHYDAGSRTLSWGRHVLKCFRQPAENQEALLLKAEEVGWPGQWMNDPLERVPGMNRKRTLHNTIQDFNRSLKSPWICLLGDGTGRRFGWEFG
ncbi:MAG TPA: hypothetical protein VKU02_17110 [Gemmataceae bacterium]|nr:hypothetical protein [Gemmataceae bacterium]